ANDASINLTACRAAHPARMGATACCVEPKPSNSAASGPGRCRQETASSSKPPAAAAGAALASTLAKRAGFSPLQRSDRLNLRFAQGKACAASRGEVYYALSLIFCLTKRT